MVRSFGLLLVVGIAIAFALALTAGFAALSLRPSGGPGAPERAASLAQTAGESGRAGEARPRRAPGPPPAQRSLPSPSLTRSECSASAWPSPSSAGAVGTQIETVSDIRSLAPQSLPAVRDLNELQDATGVSGELDVSVQAPDLTDPATIRWMAAFKQRVLSANGFGGPEPELPRRRSLPRPGALGLPHQRRRQR